MVDSRDGSDSLLGYPALPFALPDAAGKIHFLEDYAGNWLLMIFHRHLG